MRIQIAPLPSPSTSGYLEPIPFHLAQFSTPVHRGGSLPSHSSQKGMIQLQKSSAAVTASCDNFYTFLRRGEPERAFIAITSFKMRKNRFDQIRL